MRVCGLRVVVGLGQLVTWRRPWKSIVAWAVSDLALTVVVVTLRHLDRSGNGREMSCID